MRRLLVLLAALGVVAGCSTSIAGNASSEAAPTTADPASSGVDFPPRPRELKLDNLDPCASLTSAQLAKLSLEILDPSISTDPFGYTGKLCTASGFNSRVVHVSIAYMTNNGIEMAVNSHDAASGEVETTSISDFASITISLPQKNSCVADIDAAPGQLIDIEYVDGTTPPTLSKKQLCQRATAVGEAVLSSLLGS